MKRYADLFATKAAELREREMMLKSDKFTGTDNTRSSQLVKVRRERKTLLLIEELIKALPEKYDLSGPASEHLENMLTLVAERQSAIRFECRAGDKITDLLQKYANMAKLMERMQKFCDKNGLTIDWNTNTVVADPDIATLGEQRAKAGTK